jgi:DNA-binding NtrC family response regulator
LAYLATDRIAHDISPHDVEQEMARSGNNISQTANRLGVARTTVYRKLREAQSKRAVGEG